MRGDVRASDGLVIVSLLLCLGCQSDPLRYVELPASSTTRAQILMRGLGGTTVAIDPASPEAIHFEAAVDEERLFLLSYEESLDDLGLEPGPLELGQRCRSCDLLRASQSQVYVLTETESSWQTLAESPAELLELLVPDAASCAVCPELIAEDLTDRFDAFDGRETVPVLPLDGHRALIFEHTGRWSIVTSEGGVSAACITDASLQVTAAYLASPSRAWLGDDESRLIGLDLNALDPSLPCLAATTTITAPSPDAGDGLRIARVHGAPGDAVEIYAWRVDDHLLRFDARGWTDLGLQGSGFAQEPAVLYLEPGQAYASSGLVDGIPTFLIVDGDSVVNAPFRPEGGSLFAELSALARVSTFGGQVAAGTRDQVLLFETSPGNFEQAGTNTDGTPGKRVDSFVDHRRGVAISLSEGGMRFLAKDRSYCPSQAVVRTPDFPSGFAVDYLVAFDDERLLAVGHQALLLRPKVPDTCLDRP